MRTLHIIGDMQSVQDIMQVLVTSNCSVVNSTIVSFNASSIPPGVSSPSTPRPEQTIQYYRSSSFALTMDGYNNTAALSAYAPTPAPWSNTTNPPPTTFLNDTAIPSNGTDLTFISCVNTTIAQALPIMSGGERVFVGVKMMPTMGLLWIFVMVFHSFL